VLRFLTSPVELIGDQRGHVREVVVARNELVAEGGALRARDTGARERVSAGLVLRAIGYRGTPLAGVPFDERHGVIPNEGGRVRDPDGAPGAAAAADAAPGASASAAAGAAPGAGAGEYVVGWIKRGPTGVIGTNKRDAQETVDAIFEDLAAGRLRAPGAPDPEQVEALLRAARPDLVSYEGWSEIDRHERERGEPVGRPRVKLTRVEEMLRVAAAESPDEPDARVCQTAHDARR